MVAILKTIPGLYIIQTFLVEFSFLGTRFIAEVSVYINNFVFLVSIASIDDKDQLVGLYLWVQFDPLTLAMKSCVVTYSKIFQCDVQRDRLKLLYGGKIMIKKSDIRFVCWLFLFFFIVMYSYQRVDDMHADINYTKNLQYFILK